MKDSLTADRVQGTNCVGHDHRVKFLHLVYSATTFISLTLVQESVTHKCYHKTLHERLQSVKINFVPLN
jgi:hypothetical protein